MITLTITAETTADLHTHLETLLRRSTVAAATTPAVEQALGLDKASGNGAGEPGAETAPAKAGGKKAAAGAAGKAGGAKKGESVLDKKLDRSDVRAALTNYLALNDEPATAALLKKHGGVEKLSELSEDRFQAVYDAASA